MKSIKKKSAHNIYFGIDKETGKIRHISEVPGGVRCGCICAACNTPLEARKGDVRRHHFAHESNYKCVYANEVAIYKEVARIMDSERVLALPQISLQFPSWKEKRHLCQHKSARFKRSLIPVNCSSIHLYWKQILLDINCGF